MIDAEGRNLIFVLSTPRAGSTLLGALLGNHSRILCPPEPWLLLPLNAINSDNAIIASHFDHELAKKAVHDLVDQALLSRATNAFILTIYNSLLEQAGKQVFVDKTPRYYHILPSLDHLFPLAVKLWIVRNPLDVIASFKDSWGFSVEELMGEVLSPYTFDTTVSFSLLASYFEEVTPTKYIIRYEDLVEDPVSQIRAVCELVDLPFEEGMPNYGANRTLMTLYANARMGDKNTLEHSGPHRQSVGRWRHSLTLEEIRKILFTLGRSIFVRLGYGDTIDVAAAQAGIHPARIDEKGKLDQLFDQYTTYVDSAFSRSEGREHTLTARQNTQLQAQLAEAEADRLARLEVIQKQGQRLGAVEAERNTLQAQLTDLSERFGAMKAERNTLQAQLTDLSERFEPMKAERDRALNALLTISSSRTYKLLRRLGRWASVEMELSRLVGKKPAGMPPPPTKLAEPSVELEQPGQESSEAVEALGALQEAEDNPPSEYDLNYAKVPEPKKKQWVLYPPGSEDRIVQRLRHLGLEVHDYEIDVAGYHRYFRAARYREDFSNYYAFNLPEKSLEHYVAAELLQLGAQDVYIDVASEHSPAPVIYNRLFGTKTYRQDLAYPPGLHGDRIGGNAAEMPVVAGFATKMALHCSFEHFEGDSDIRFIREIARVLKPGGAVCVVPLYLFEEYAIQTDPVVAVSEGVVFESEATVYCAQDWKNRHGRFYDPEHFVSRVCQNLGALKVKIYRFTNAQQVDKSCYARFAMLISRPEAV